MTRTRTRKALYLGLPIFLILVGGGLLAWKTFGPSEAGYPRKVMKHAEELHERILSFDSRITIPPDFGTEGNEFDKDGPNQLDLVKAGRGRLSGAALAIFGWPEMWNGPDAPHKPTPVSSTRLVTSRKFVTRFSPAWSRLSQPGRHRLLPRGLPPPGHGRQVRHRHEHAQRLPAGRRPVPAGQMGRPRRAHVRLQLRRQQRLGRLLAPAALLQ